MYLYRFFIFNLEEKSYSLVKELYEDKPLIGYYLENVMFDNDCYGLISSASSSLCEKSLFYQKRKILTL